MTVSRGSGGRPERALELVRAILARATPGAWASPTWVDGWVEEGGGAIPVVYDEVGADRRLGYRSELDRTYLLDSGAPFADAVELVTDAICEPLGRQSDLLVEEQGVWWWGDGYPDLDYHPDATALREYMAALKEHLVSGGPKPPFPGLDKVEAEFGPLAVLVVEADDSWVPPREPE